MPKSAIEKLNAKKQHKIVDSLPDGITWAPPGSRMVVSTPAEVNAIMQCVPLGKVITISDIRNHLAQKYGTDIACPISTGIFINIAAHAAEEMRAQGNEIFTPYWRTLKADGLLNEKYPGGMERQRKLLKAEGISVQRRGKKFYVPDFEALRYSLTSI